LARLWLAVAVGYLALGATLQLLPYDLPRRFGSGPAGVALLTGLAFLATAIVRPLAGWRADAGRARRTVISGGLFTTAGAVVQFVGPGVLTFGAGRLLMGAGEAMLFSAALPWALHGVPASRRGRVAGRFGLSMWTGLTVGPAVAAVILSTSSVTLAWMFVMSAGLVSALLATSTSRRPSHRTDEGTRFELTALAPRGSRGPGLYLGLCGYAYGTIVGVLLLHAYANDLPVSWFLPMFAGAFLLTRAIGSPLVDRHGPVAVGAVLATLAAVALVSLPRTGDPILALAETAAAGIGVALAYPCAASLTLARSRSDRAGRAVAAMTSWWDLGMFAAGCAGGAIAAHAGYTAAFLTAGAASAVAAACLVMMRRNQGAANHSTVGGGGPAGDKRTWAQR
jgi:MFS family permease